MNIKQEMRGLLDDLKKSTDKYSSIVKEYESADYILENEGLKKEIQSVKERLEGLTAEAKKVKEENFSLKVALNEQIMDEKLGILKISRKKREIFFQNASQKTADKLSALEERINESVKKFEAMATGRIGEGKEDILTEIRKLSEKLLGKIEEQRKKIQKEEKTIVQSIKEGYEALSSEPVDEETMQKRMKRNKLELKIGLSWINKIGILLILIGVGYAAKYSYSNWFTDTMRGISFFVLGGIFLGCGEFLYQKGKDVFAKGLLGGGISILYASVFISYFMYEIIGFQIALLLLVLVTLVSVVLSIRYNSQTIGGFALIGGYLPLVSFIHDIVSHGNALAAQDIYGMMGYLFVLNVLMLLISFWKRWNIIMYISFFLYISCLIYLVFNVDEYAIAIAYSIVTFAMYQAIILLYPLKYKLKLAKMDVLLLGLNTFISCLVIYLLFRKAELTSFNGLLALVFAAIYIGLGQIVQRVMKQEKETLVLFYGTALTFAILMIPFQFGIHWMTIGWLVEGIVLTIAGYKQKIRYLELAGWGITALCVLTFYFVDFFPYLSNPARVKYFKIKYASVIAGMIAILFMYLRAIDKDLISRHSNMGKAITGFKYFVVASFWIFLNIVGLHYYDKLVAAIRADDPSFSLNDAFYRSIIVALLHVGLAFALSKIRLVHDRVIQVFNVALYAIAIIICLYIDTAVPVLKPSAADNTAFEYVALGILIAFNILILITARELVLRVMTRLKSNLEFYPLVICVYLLAVATSFVVVQFDLGHVNLLLTFVYLAVAIGCIVYGFARKFSYVRLFGLGIIFIALAKLFFWDLRFLKDNIGARIIAFFGFGLCMLGISFLYQKIKNIVEVPDASIKKK